MVSIKSRESEVDVIDSFWRLIRGSVRRCPRFGWILIDWASGARNHEHFH